MVAVSPDRVVVMEAKQHGEAFTLPQLGSYLSQHAHRGRLVGRTVSNPRRGGAGRPNGSGRFGTRAQALEAFQKAYARAYVAEGRTEPTTLEVARALGTGRSTVYWWMERWGISLPPDA